MDFQFIAIGILLLILIGLVIKLIKNGSAQTDGTIDSEKLVFENEHLNQEKTRLTEELHQLKSELQSLQNKLNDSNILVAKLETENSERKKHEESLKQEVEAINEQFKNQFKVMAGEILKQNSKDFSDYNKNLLVPLKEKIVDFETVVRKKIEEDTKTSENLKVELKNLREMNLKISEEANNLTKALKGDNKTQGNWGELILEKILEKSGLEKDVEYKTQVSLTAKDGSRVQPDVVVSLPDEKHIVIDSKVSLVAYDSFVNATSDEEMTKYLKAHLDSIRTHIKQLSEKNYEHALGINPPDFILMFVPIESSFSIAIKEDIEIFNFAWDKNIVIVSPSTLLASLRTIASLWKQEKQSRNVIQIAEESGKLYDKFVGFISDIQDIGKSLDKAQSQYGSAMNKLTTGNGNIVSKIEKLKTLGAKTKKQLDNNLSDE